MKTSKTMVYALTCLKELANQYGEFVQVSEIARKHDLPASYCQKILLTLSQTGIVESVKGRGFTLVKPAETITALQVLKALSGSGRRAGGGSGFYPADMIGRVLAERLDQTLSELRLSEMLSSN